LIHCYAGDSHQEVGLSQGALYTLAHAVLL
jgi:hypothetical protein